MRRAAVLALVGALAGATTVLVGAAAPASATPAVSTTPGTYVPLAKSVRAVDTRKAGTGAREGVLSHGGTLTATIKGVPTNAVVQGTLSAVSPTSTGVLTAYQYGTARQKVTHLLYAPGHTTSDAVLVPLSGGKLSVYNSATTGSTQIVLDVSGYYVGGSTPDTPGLLHAVKPTRAYDSASTSAKTVPAGGSVVIHMGSYDGYAKLSTVAAMISVTTPAKSGSVIAYPADETPRPATSTVYFTAGTSTTGLVMARTDVDGLLRVYNTSAAAQRVVVDVVAYVSGGHAASASEFERLPVSRVYSAHTMTAGLAQTYTLGGRGGVPKTGVAAVVVNLAVSGAAKSGGLSTLPVGAAKSAATTNLQFLASRSMSNLAVVPVTSAGQFQIYNTSAGSVNVYVDVYGYIPSTTLPVPSTQIGHYLTNLTATHSDTDDSYLTTDGNAMRAYADSDAAANRTTVLLDLGAQTTAAPLSTTDRGILLALTGTRLSYTDLSTLISDYITEYRAKAPSASLTLLAAVNNEGDWKAYPATTRGSDFSAMLAAVPATSGVTLKAAVDFEPDFDDNDGSLVSNAKTWETSFLAQTATQQIVFIGSADGCATAFGTTAGTCDHAWKQSDLYSLAGGANSRITAVPQLYASTQAAQWTNIDATGGGKIVFGGALTQYGRAADQLSPAQGYVALYRALATLSATPTLSAQAVDLAVNGS